MSAASSWSSGRQADCAEFRDARRDAPRGRRRHDARDRATRPDNVLEAEKILGTVHIALGDNSGFGGTVSTPYHEDYVFYQPTLTAIRADGTRTTVLRKGSLEI